MNIDLISYFTGMMSAFLLMLIWALLKLLKKIFAKEKSSEKQGVEK